MKRLRKIIRLLVGIILSAYLLLLILVKFSPMQQLLTQAVAEALEERLGTEVRVGELEVGLFNRVLLHDIYVSDRSRRPMLQAKLATAKLSLRSLFQPQLVLRSISLLDAHIHLYKASPDAPLNCQFVIDAFSSKDTHKPSALNLRIGSLILRRVNVSYDESYKPASPGRFNPAHLHITGLNANISLREISLRQLRLRIRSLAFTEQSGLQLENLSLYIEATRTAALIHHLDLRTAASHIRLKDIRATYDVRRSFHDLLPTLSFDGEINKALLSSEDFRPFIKFPAQAHLAVSLSARLSVSPRRLRLDGLQITEAGNRLSMTGNLSISRSQDKLQSITLRKGQLHISPDLSRNLVSWATPDTSLVRMAERAGELSATIEGIYARQEGDAHLRLTSAVGNFEGYILWKGEKLRTGFSLTSASPAAFLGKPRLPESVNIHGQATLQFARHKVSHAAGSVTIPRLVWNGRTLGSINLVGSWQDGKIQAQVGSTDPAARLQARTTAAFVGKRCEQLSLQAHIEDFRPTLLGLSSPYGAASFGGTIEADLTRRPSGSPRGHVSLSRFRMTDSPRGDYELQNLEARFTDGQDGGDHLRLQSDFLDADIDGPLSPALFLASGKSLLARALPGLVNTGKRNAPAGKRWTFRTTLKRTDVIEKMLAADFTLQSPLHLDGMLDGGAGRSSLQLWTDGFAYAGQGFGRTTLYLTGAGDRYNCLTQTHRQIAGKDISLAARFQTADSSLVSDISWDGNTPKRYNGQFKSTTRFLPSSGGGTSFAMHIHPSQFFLADTLWHIASGNLSLHGKQLTIRGVNVGHADQSLAIDGRLAPGKGDSIVARLHGIDISYLLGFVNFHAVEFGGRADGEAVFTQKDGTPQVRAHLNLPAFTLNGSTMGATLLHGGWSKADNRILLDADMRPADIPEAHTRVQGFVDLAAKGLELHIGAEHTDLRFLRRYMEGIFENFEGEATGQVNLYGPFKALDFNGSVKADASARIPATGVSYKVKGGTVDFSPGKFAFHNFRLSDNRGGGGQADGTLRHTHLKKLRYDFSLTANRLLCYDRPAMPGLPFASTTVGTGNVRLSGRPGFFTADISLRPDAPTTLTYTLGGTDTPATSGSMVRFHNAAAPATPVSTDGTASAPQEDVPESTTDITLNFLINATPAAQVKIVTDPRAGDAITAWGSGPIRAVWHNKGSFEMYGTYEVSRGTYRMSIQDVIRKELTLRSGSKLTFTGPPMQADLDLHAAYTINGVSLGDLGFSTGFSGKTARVDCLLNIGGKARSPQVSFDLDLKGISDDEKQMIRQLIATDEDMNRQAIYLLGIGRFYTASATSGEASSSTTSSQQSSAAMRSFLSSTLTGQLNSAISSALGGQSHWSFGTNVATGTLGWSELEVDGLLQGRLLNDRLLINGNFGYRDYPTYTSNFVGDFDVRYLLTPRGTISLRAYSETTDRYFTKAALTTQGIGLTLQRDFSRFKQLFQWKRSKKKGKTGTAGK